jgi:hypothetical protein
VPAQAFGYDAEQDVVRCFGGQMLNSQGKPVLRDGLHRQRYESKACHGCALRAQCLPDKGAIRTMYRSEDTSQAPDRTAIAKSEDTIIRPASRNFGVDPMVFCRVEASRASRVRPDLAWLARGSSTSVNTVQWRPIGRTANDHGPLIPAGGLGHNGPSLPFGMS